MIEIETQVKSSSSKSVTLQVTTSGGSSDQHQAKKKDKYSTAITEVNVGVRFVIKYYIVL